MTNKELLVELLHEVTHEDKDLLAVKVKMAMQVLEKERPGSTGDFANTLSPAEAAQLLDEMRQKQAEIVEWFTRTFSRAV